MTAKELKTQVYNKRKIEDVLHLIGCGEIKYHPHKRYWTCSNADGDNPSAVVVKNNPYIGVANYTRRFKDNADIIDLIKYNTGYEYKQAIRVLKEVCQRSEEIEILCNAVGNASAIEVEEYEPKQSSLSESVLQEYEPRIFIDWYKNGVMPWARDKFDLRYDYGRNRVVIPIRDHATGKLLAINCRTTVPEWKELGIIKYDITKGYLKHLNVYGLWENREAIKKAGYAIIYESERSVLKRYSLTDATGLALQGHTLSDVQAKILAELNVDLIVSMDADICLEEIRYLCNKLYEAIKNKGLQNKVFYTFDKNKLMGEKDSIADQPRKIFDAILADKVLFDETERNLYLESLNKIY